MAHEAKRAARAGPEKADWLHLASNAGCCNSEQMELRKNAAERAEEASRIVDPLYRQHLVAFKDRRALPDRDLLSGRVRRRVEALGVGRPLPLILSPGGLLDVSQTLLSHLHN
ncbi:hypothetical protein [Mesorhizobium sp. M0910]|uniref:hypothetical protein n=1 Tax=Mesorhizobium sp. M0910 TaxID=2957025 RepID=UPI0033376412